MSTVIGLLKDERDWSGAYVRFDGDLEGVGEQLIACVNALNGNGEAEHADSPGSTSLHCRRIAQATLCSRSTLRISLRARTPAGLMR